MGIEKRIGLKFGKAIESDHLVSGEINGIINAKEYLPVIEHFDDLGRAAEFGTPIACGNKMIPYALAHRSYPVPSSRRDRIGVFTDHQMSAA